MGGIKPELLGEIFAAQAEALALYAKQWCDCPRDVVQEAFLKLARQQSQPDRVVPWLYQVVRNRAIEIRRGDGRRRKREARASEAKAWFVSGDDGLDAEAAASLLAELDPETRGVVVARIWGGLTFEQIAEAQSCSQATAHRRYRSGIERLHQRLERS